jgi:glutamine amidotransferase-like uncharacterized protein
MPRPPTLRVRLTAQCDEPARDDRQQGPPMKVPGQRRSGYFPGAALLPVYLAGVSFAAPAGRRCSE